MHVSMRMQALGRRMSDGKVIQLLHTLKSLIGFVLLPRVHGQKLAADGVVVCCSMISLHWECACAGMVL